MYIYTSRIIKGVSVNTDFCPRQFLLVVIVMVLSILGGKHMDMSKRYYKYIHIFYGHDSKFSSNIVELFKSTSDGFNFEEHFFVVAHKEPYEDLIKITNSNIILDDSGENLYKKYYRHCKWIFSYGCATPIQVLCTPKHILKRILYRYGGGSRTTHFKKDLKHPVKALKGWIKTKLFKYNMESFAGIGIANMVDIRDLSALIDKQKYYKMPYSSYYTCQSLELTKNENRRSIQNDYFKVLLGHRGTHENNHIEILYQLEKFRNEPIQIYVPLSYGNNEYIEKIKEYIRNYHWDSIIIIDQYLNYDAYLQLLNSMDVAIFDGCTSYALGNISILLFFNKTIFLNRDGIISKVLDEENTQHRYIDELEKCSFEEFIRCTEYNMNKPSDLSAAPYQTMIDNWKLIFEDFD